MASYNLSKIADADLDQIYEHSILEFGLGKAQEYFLGLHNSFSLLADNPLMGRDVSHIKEGYRRHEYKSHSVYYTVKDFDILIVKILHKHQDPFKNLLR